MNTEWTQIEVIDLINDGTGLGFGIIGGRSTGVVVKTILPGGVADAVSIVLEEKSRVKFINFGTPEIFAVIYLKFKQRGQTLKGICQNGANGIANSEDPDQTAPL